MKNLLILSSLVLVAPASAQSALLREDDPSPDGTPGQVISGIGSTNVNAAGGASCSLTTSGPNGSVSQIWGNLSGGANSLLREESTIGNLEQGSFELRFGTSASGVIYGASSTNTVTGATALDNVWFNDTLLLNEGEQPAGSPDFWTFAENQDITTAGVPYCRAGISATAGGSTDRRGIYMGSPLTAIYFTGDLLPNMPLPLSTTAVDADFRISADGSQSILAVDLDSSTTDDAAVALNQAGLVLGGTLVREGEAVPPSIGGIGDDWSSFDFFGITDAGEYMFTGNTNGPSASNEFIVRNGSIWAREGDMLGGELLSGSIEGASMNASGEIAFVWSIDVGPGAPDEALFLDDQLLLQEGDAVDWDGDGVIDPAITIQSFTGFNTVTLADNGSVYFTADVDVNGTTLEGYFVLPGSQIGTSYCMANVNSTGVSTDLRVIGSDVASLNDVTLVADNIPLNQFGYFLNSQTQGFLPNPNNSQGNLCVLGNIGRYNAQLFNSGSSGTGSLILDLTNTPQPLGAVSIVAGETWNFQCWHRDLNPAPTSNFSQGVSILFQ